MEKLQYYIVGDCQCKIFHKDTSSFIFRFIKSKLVVGCNDFPEKLEILLFHCFRENWWKPQSTIRQGGRLEQNKAGGGSWASQGEVYSLSWLLACGKYQLLDCSRFCHIFTLTWETSTRLDMVHSGGAEVVLATRTDIKISFQHTMLLITHNTHGVPWQKYNFQVKGHKQHPTEERRSNVNNL